MSTALGRFAGVASVAALAVAMTACAGPQALRGQPDSFNLGRNAAGEPCTATRNWRDPAMLDSFDQSWSIGCRNVAASRSLGSVRLLHVGESHDSISRTLNCGDARAVQIANVGAVQARRCYDSLLATPSVSFETAVGNRFVIVSAAESVLGPAEEAVRLIVGHERASTDNGRTVTPAIQLAALGAAPAGTDAHGAAAFDSAVALSDGINLNHKGLYVQASRVLNDALSRLPASASPATRAELLLEAGLADSNIRFSDSAAEHFTEADTLLAAAGAGPRITFLGRKRDAYRALDLLNQRKFREALAALDRLVSAPAPVGQPLEDAATVRLLNQPGRSGADVSSSIAVPETAALQQLVLDGQASWARSVALLALGDETGAQAALDRATAAYRPLVSERIDPTLIQWLGAHINRQEGRLEARRHQYPAAIASFDRALAQLRQGALNTAGTGTEPTIAETALERAGIIADAGGDPQQIRREYDAAIDLLIDANEVGGATSLPNGVARYLDLLIADAGRTHSPDTYERFFRAVQAVGEPAVARQLTQLQSVVTADPAIGVKVRDRAELEREITKLRYDISAAAQAGQATTAMEQQRATAEARLYQLDAELGASARYRAIDDRPATIAELRQALRPGEGFFKLVELNSRAYGMYVSSDRTFIYPIVAPKTVLDGLATRVRASIDGRLDQGQMVPFAVPDAYTLFALITGPATDAMLHASALVVDPAGPLQNLPAGVLVTDRASVDRYAASKTAAPFDFSHVGFLAGKLPISTALSPRSFLVARALPPSTARQAFLGLGEHQPAPTPTGDDATRQVSVGFGCTVNFSTLADLSHQLRPIAREELVLASAALGVPDAPEVTGAAFSDTAVENRTDLADFEVLHFATHGLEEGVWGCNKSPPALVTSFGDANSDGLLSFDEIARLRLDANLVVLSACDTASGVRDEALARRSGQEEAGSTLEGLVRAFLTANSRAVLATFWPVSAGQETDQFIQRFYSVARQQSIGGSLQTAQETLMHNPEFSHPFYWGPYFVVGDSTKMMLSNVHTATPGSTAAPAAGGTGTATR
ncbi:CHAT domain-containing protein [Sphingomonas sp.]|uniref:CHAT domain-containing protein n=1 Tax=Sphingomonas sp. TaxID=28214 RepID=UPI003CC61332